MDNLVIISIDSLRNDSISLNHSKNANNSPTTLTKNIDEFLREGTCIQNSYSTNTYTTSAHASLFTGSYPFDHGIRSFYSEKQKLNSQISTIAELLSKQKFETFFYSDVPELFSEMNIWRGFKSKTYSRLNWLWNSVEECKKKNNFIFIHLFDVHEPYLFFEDQSIESKMQEEYYEMISTLQKKLSIKSSLNTKKNPHDSWQEIRKKIANNQIDQQELLKPYYDKGVNKFDALRFPDIINKLDMLGIRSTNSLYFIISDHGEGRTSFDKNNKDFAHGGEITESVIRNVTGSNANLGFIYKFKVPFSITFIKHISLLLLGIKSKLELPIINSNPFNIGHSIYAESFLNFVEQDLPHGITDRGTIVTIAKEKRKEIPSILKNRALINFEHKFIINGIPEKIHTLSIEKYNFSEIVEKSFTYIFSRKPDGKAKKDFQTLLKNGYSLKAFIKTLLASEEKKQKPFVIKHKINTTKLSDRLIDPKIYDFLYYFQISRKSLKNTISSIMKFKTIFYILINQDKNSHP